MAPDGTILRSVRALNSYVEQQRRREADLERLELVEKQAAGLKARLEQAQKKVDSFSNRGQVGGKGGTTTDVEAAVEDSLPS